MSKRFYLCNLIPLWAIDDEALDADWTVETANNGDLVELRVEVMEGPLDPGRPDFFASFEIYESDFLLTGGANDLTARFATPGAEGEEGVERRPVKLWPKDSTVPEAEKLTAIWVSPGEETGLIRAFWTAQRLDDSFGEPEFYFDVKVGLNGREAKERATRELTVGPAQPKTAGATGRSPVAAIVTAAGWSAPRATLDEDEIRMVARVSGGVPGMTLRFEILDVQTRREAIEQIDVMVGASPIVTATWKPRRPLPEAAWGPLSFRAYFEDIEERITLSATHEAGAVVEGELYATLRPETVLEVVLTDAAGKPLAKQPYILRDDTGFVLIESETGAGGVIRWIGLGEREVTLELPDLVATGAEEVAPPVIPPDTGGVVFSLFDIRPPLAPRP